MSTEDFGKLREEWIDKCAARFIERVSDISRSEAYHLAEVGFDEIADGDLTEDPVDTADEELSCWGD